MCMRRSFFGSRQFTCGIISDASTRSRVTHRNVHQRVQQGIRQVVRLQPQINQFGVRSVVIVLLGLHPRIGNVIDFHGDAHLFRGPFHHVRQVQHGKLFRELVVNAALALFRRVLAGDLHAAHRVSNIQEAPRLSALAIHRQWLPDGRLHAEAIQYRANTSS